MATTGNTATPTGTDDTGAFWLAYRFTMPEAGTLTNISAYCDNTGGTPNNLVFGLYSDNAGTPGTQLATTGTVVEPGGGPPTSLISGAASVALVNGTAYFIVVSNAATAIAPSGHQTGVIATGTLYYSQDNTGTGLPGTNAWTGTGNFGTSTGDICAYITYTPSGASASTRKPYERSIPMRPGPRGFTKGTPFRFSTSNPLNLQTVFPGVGALTLTGFAPTVSVSNNQVVLPGVGDLTVTGFAPTVTSTLNAQPTPRAYQMNIPMRPVGGGLVIGTPFRFATQIQSGASIVTPGVGDLTLTGFAPTISVSNNQAVLPGLGALTVTGFAPVVLSGDQKVVQPGVGALVATGFAPTVNATANITLTPGTGQVVLTGYAPTVTASDSITVQPGTGVLVLTGYAPIVNAISAGALTGSLTLTPSLTGAVTLTPSLSGSLLLEPA